MAVTSRWQLLIAAAPRPGPLLLALLALLVLAGAQRMDPVHGTAWAGAPPPPLIDDATLQREYEDYRSSLTGQKLYEVQYIRVDDEATARQVIARIRSGASFEDEVARVSTDPKSRANGGRLGTFASCRWGRDTRALLDGLADGQVGRDPLPGTHGWGIYRLVSQRPAEPVPFPEYREAFLAGRFKPECPWQPPVQIRREAAPPADGGGAITPVESRP